MADVIKNLLYAGAGLAAASVEKFQTTVDDLVEKGKITDKEGRKIVKDFLKTSEKKRTELENKLKNASEDVFEKFDFFKNSDFDALEKRVKSLEIKFGKMTKQTATTKTSKRSTKKSVNA